MFCKMTIAIPLCVVRSRAPPSLFHRPDSQLSVLVLPPFDDVYPAVRRVHPSESTIKSYRAKCVLHRRRNKNVPTWPSLGTAPRLGRVRWLDRPGGAPLHGSSNVQLWNEQRVGAAADHPQDPNRWREGPIPIPN